MDKMLLEDMPFKMLRVYVEHILSDWHDRRVTLLEFKHTYQMNDYYGADMFEEDSDSDGQEFEVIYFIGEYESDRPLCEETENIRKAGLVWDYLGQDMYINFVNKEILYDAVSNFSESNEII